jgi:hypothetical protein
MHSVTVLSELAEVGLGFKSLQNDFFYVTPETVATYRIEPRFLRPIYTLADLDAHSFIQSASAAQLLFGCEEDEKDLRGTGALRYIKTMAERTAAKKKQTGKTQTIREALQLQGGRLWYAPKAAEKPSRIWLRKGVGGVFSPFIFSTAAVVDQRCNFAIAKDGVGWDELAALLSSTVFSYAAEINGSTSMGAGVLELATTKLRNYPVPDIRSWSPKARAKLIELGEEVWKEEAPPDWANGARPGKSLKALDVHLLDHLSSEVTTTVLYRDLHEAIRARYRLAADKGGKQKKKQTESVASVSSAIVERIRPMLEAHPYPEGFVSDPAESEEMDLTGCTAMQLFPMMGQVEVEVYGPDRTPLVEATLPEPVAHVLARALLLGRRHFSLPRDEGSARMVIKNAAPWLKKLRARVAELIGESAAGSGYEEAVTKNVFRLLGMHAHALEKDVSHDAAFTQ